MELSLAEALEKGEEVDKVSIPFVRYQFEFRVRTTIMLPDYAGSAIRGAFGRSLRHLACMTHQSDCKSCPLYRSCPYSKIFETPPPENHSLQKFSQIPSGYVIEPPCWGRKVYEPGESLFFSLVLFGSALNSLAVVIYAFQKAFDFDVGHGKADLVSVKALNLASDAVIYGSGIHSVVDHPAYTVVNVPKGGEQTIQLETPLRLQKNGIAIAPEDITARAFFSTLLRRVALLMEFHNSTPLAVDFLERVINAEEIPVKKDLHWQDWVRYSSRQKQMMHLGGVTGTMSFSGLDSIWRILLAVGEYSHLGKNASFGLGKYHVC